MKCNLLTDGIRIDEGSFDLCGANLSRIHLYDYGVSAPKYDIPFDIILYWVDGERKRLPIIVRVRFKNDSPWYLEQNGDNYWVVNSENEESHHAEILKTEDFGGQNVMGQPLEALAQRLGYDLLGLVPTNYCSFYQSGKKCAFCEIVETHNNLASGTPYRKSLELLTMASVAAAERDKSLTSITYNGGQLNSLDETVNMYVQLLEMISKFSATSRLNKTIACMPPETPELLENLAQAGLNQYFINVETMDKNLMPYLAPYKSQIGLTKMLEGLERSLPIFGIGSVYSNLVYGVQTIGKSWPVMDFNPLAENEAMLCQSQELIERNVIPTFTIYHTSGRNKIGSVHLSGNDLFNFTVAYGNLVRASECIEPSRGAILFSIGSLPNTTYNDGWLLADMHHKLNEAESDAYDT